MQRSILKKFYIFLILLLLLPSLSTAQQWKCDPTEVKVIARDAENNLLPNIRVQIWKQTTDADGNPVGQSLVAQQTTNATGAVGEALLTFRVQNNPEEQVTPYAIKLFQYSDRFGTFWNYGFSFSCGGSYTHEFKLATLKVKIRNPEGELSYNQPISLYTQKTDADGNYYAADLIANTTTGSTGEAKLYVNKGYYMVKTRINNTEYTISGITMREQAVTNVDYYPSNTTIIIREGSGIVRPDSEVEIYEQTTDVDNNKITGKRITLARTNKDGKITVNLKPGTYALVIKGSDRQRYYLWDNVVTEQGSLLVDYKLSTLKLILQDSEQKLLTNKTVEIYKQERDVNDNIVLGKRLGVYKTNNQGYVKIFYPPGKYILKIPSDGNGFFYRFDNITLKEQQQTEVTKTLSKIRVKTISGNAPAFRRLVTVRKQRYDATAKEYLIGNIITTVFTDDIRGVVDIYLPHGSYYLVYKDQIKRITTSKDFHEYVLNGLKEDKPVSPAPSKPKANTLAERLKGKILLQVESHGEAWYVHEDGKRYYLKDGRTAFELLRRFGLGITNANLNKIPIGIERRFKDVDSDQDGLPDKLEDALGSNPQVADTDNDGYPDGTEVFNGYSPTDPSPTKVKIDKKLAERLKGKILLQVESHGEAWYVHEDGKRYYMKDGEAAFNIMRFLSLGITNDNLSRIPEGKL